MRAAGSPAGDFDTWLADAADCARACAGHLRGALRVLAGAPGPGWRGAPWGRRQTRPAGFGEWPGGPGGPWGGWRPSPGAVYPALQQLADEGLVDSEESTGRRTFSLTEAGRRHIEENPDAARAAWESMATDNSDEMPGLFAQAAQLAGSIVQMAHVGTPGQVRAAEALLEQTRHEMYQILGGGEGSEQDREQE